MIALLYWRELADSERNVARIVEFMGAEIRLVDLNAVAPGNPVPAGARVIVRAGTLVELAASGSSEVALCEWLGGAAKSLIYGFEATVEHGRLLNRLTSGGFTGVEGLTGAGAKFSGEAGAADVCFQFAGLGFGQADQTRDLVFTEGARLAGCRSLIRIGARPFFVSVTSPGGEMLLLAGRQVASLDEVVPRGASLVDCFSRLAPLLMFLRWAEGKRCWHNDTPRASLIIDDPLLQEQYGFLDYDQLLGLMERERFSTTIAFIPWNYRRSQSRIVELFRQHPRSYALCVHGCDHTGGEFGDTDLKRLESLAREGLHRMARHQELAGLGFDDVMVFPQGNFSTVAMTALKSCGYLAAVNSTPFPVDGKGEALRLRDLMDGAVTKFSGFPLFTRHYPRDLAGLAFALLLGKPALLVEHHGYFRNGYAPLAEVVRTLRQMEPRLEWARLSVICSQACLKRRAANGEVEVRFYTDRFCLRNDTGMTQRYVLFQRQADGEPLPCVLANNVPVAVEREAEDLRLSVELGAGQAAEIEVRRARPEASGVNGRPGAMRQAGVFVRRHLSEFRDNHVDKNPLLSRVASRVRNHLVGRK